MTRVSEALRSAGQMAAAASSSGAPFAAGRSVRAPQPQLLELVPSVPFQPASGAILLDPLLPWQGPAEEFRTLRTRLNHLPGPSPIQTLVVTSPSAGEGKSFVAANLALAQAQLADNPTLLCDFDLRRPVLHQRFQIDREPGITDYLEGRAELYQAMRRVGDTNLFLMPAGAAVTNPLELINRKEAELMLDFLASVFRWVVLDTPPLLQASDANLLGTLCHGTVLVARMGSTTTDSITRAVQSLCRNNVVGIVANAARHSDVSGRPARAPAASSASA
jgi:capsular exopolysaccharide synthesis family protein